MGWELGGSVGSDVGTRDGACVGCAVGNGVGCAVGDGSGACVGVSVVETTRRFGSLLLHASPFPKTTGREEHNRSEKANEIHLDMDLHGNGECDKKKKKRVAEESQGGRQHK